MQTVPAPPITDRHAKITGLMKLLRASSDWLWRSALLGAVLLATGCARETLFRSDFDATPVNQPPAHQQAVGTANVLGPPGSVIVIPAPVSPSGQWVQISRPHADTGLPEFQGVLSAVRGPGEYVFSATVLIPSRSGIATIQFESLAPPTSFFHLDLMPDNTIRLDDEEGTQFGQFPRNEPFLIQVTLHLGESPRVRVSLAGAGAFGEAERDIRPALHFAARQFAATRLWIGFPHIGTLNATNIVVTRKKD